MLTERLNDTASMQWETTSAHERFPPPWFPELTLLARWFTLQWVLLPICSALHLPRRVDATAGIDVLLMFLAAHTGNCALNHAHKALEPVASVVPKLWGRERLVSRSAASRFLSALDAASMDTMQTLFCKRFAPSDVRANTQGA
jgi:hypothetical protein